MLLESLEVTARQFFEGTGWEITPEGACKSDVCVPLDGSKFDLHHTAERLGMALVTTTNGETSALGPATFCGTALASAEAPELELPDHRGASFRLSSLRGQKVLLVAWAPY